MAHMWKTTFCFCEYWDIVYMNVLQFWLIMIVSLTVGPTKTNWTSMSDVFEFIA